MIKAVIAAENENISKKLVNILSVLFEGRVCFDVITIVGDFKSKLKAKEADILLTIDLAGFDRATLTDNLTYNLLDCKQIHIITQTKLKNENYLNKLLSIAMFFGIAGNELTKQIEVNYPNIPWIGCMGGWNVEESVYSMENAKEIAKIIEKILIECKMLNNP